MILLRSIQLKDLEQVNELTNIPGFLTLKGDTDGLRSLIKLSIKSFNGDAPEREKAKFIFVVEDTEADRVIGVSMIAAKHGTLDNPHFYFQLDVEERHSKTIDKTFSHRTLKLEFDVDGPSEIGGLVVHPDYRQDHRKIGRQISFARFLYLSLNPNKFENQIIAELLPPLDSDRKAPLWEAVGRRFTEMDYWEANDLCETNKEFIFSLFPLEKIYVTLLSGEAQVSIGDVGSETKSAFHMLKKIGFKYRDQVDPFDGGPHLWAEVSDIECVKKCKNYVISDVSDNSTSLEVGLLMKSGAEGGFLALQGEVLKSGNSLKITDSKIKNYLGLVDGDAVTFMPYY